MDSHIDIDPLPRRDDSFNSLAGLQGTGFGLAGVVNDRRTAAQRPSISGADIYSC
jgi:hypothetical protein